MNELTDDSNVDEKAEEALEPNVNVCASNEINVLEMPEAVRLRPAMYIGGTDLRGLHHTFVEISDNAMNEAMSGYCDRIDACLHRDGSLSVRDNGRGINASIVAESGLPLIEDIFVRLSPTRQSGQLEGRYHVSGGLHGVGLFVVAALSQWIQVDSWNGGNHLEIEFSKGKTSKPLTTSKLSESTGTCVRWLPDGDIFPGVQFRPNIILDRLQELAGISPGLVATFHDETAATQDSVFHYPGGIDDYLPAITSQVDALHAPISFHANQDDIIVDGALQFHSTGNHNFRIYCNAVRTSPGAPHSAFKQAVSRAVSVAVKRLNLPPRTSRNTGIWRAGGPSVHCIMSIRMWNPLYTLATKVRLDSPETHRPVFRAVYSAICNALTQNPELTMTLYQST